MHHRWEEDKLIQNCGYFFSTKNNFYSIKINLKQYKNDNIFLTLYEEENTVKMFIDALAHNEYDNAESYISKNFAKDFDLYELTDFFNNMEKYKSLIKVEFSPKPKNCKTNSILVMNKDRDSQSIIHLHLIKEPDMFSNWKIYGIEKE